MIDRGVPQILCFKIEGRPSPWARARVVGKRFFKSRAQEATQRHIATVAKMAAAGLFFEGPLELICTFYFKRPLKGREFEVFHDIRPDADNLIKQIKDSLNAVVWKDDCQVSDAISRKRWADEDYTWVEIRAL